MRDHQETPSTAAGRKFLGLVHAAPSVVVYDFTHHILAIEAEAAARQVPPTGLYVERLKAMVGRTSHMGTCSQTHHEHLMLDALALLSAGDKAEAPPKTHDSNGGDRG